jgi:exosortase
MKLMSERSVTLLDSQPWLRAVVRELPLIVAGAVLLGPTFARLGEQVWSREFGAHGPIVLATGAWLLWRRLPEMAAGARRGHLGLTIFAAAASLLVYAAGRAFDLISLEAAGVYGFGLAVLHDRFGVRQMLRNWFPILYLGLLLPIPGWMLDEFTAPLKLFVSAVSAGIAGVLGVPIVRDGVTMTAGPYLLLVEDACSGLNSLIGLVSITLFYVYLARSAGWKYTVFLLSLIIPIAIFANVIRIVILILLTYHFGDAVGQGFLHVTAGLVLFGVSLVLMFAIDSFASRVLKIRSVGL